MKKQVNRARWSVLLVRSTTAIGLLCILVLACTLTQARLTTISVDGVNIGIWKLDDTRTQWKKLRDRMHDQSETLFKAKQDLDEAQQKLADDESTYRPAPTPLDTRIQDAQDRHPHVRSGACQSHGGEPREQISLLDPAKGRLLQTHPDLAGDDQ